MNDYYKISERDDVISAAFYCGEGFAFLRWLSIKYIKRAGLKVTGDKTQSQCCLEDLYKAADCLNRMIEHVKENSA